MIASSAHMGKRNRSAEGISSVKSGQYFRRQHPVQAHWDSWTEGIQFRESLLKVWLKESAAAFWYAIKVEPFCKDPLKQMDSGR
jgi:hypothetical protein